MLTIYPHGQAAEGCRPRAQGLPAKAPRHLEVGHVGDPQTLEIWGKFGEKLGKNVENWGKMWKIGEKMWKIGEK